MKKQCLKKTLSVMIAMVISVSIFPMEILSAFAFGSQSSDDNWEGFDEFSSKVSKLLDETKEDNYISAISLDIESGKMVVDGEEQPLVEGRDFAPVTKDDTVMLPVRTLAECEDAAVSYDSEQSVATVQTEDKEIVFTQGDITAEVSGAETEEKTSTLLAFEPEMIDDTMYVPLDAMAEFLGYDTETVDESKLLLTKPY